MNKLINKLALNIFKTFLILCLFCASFLLNKEKIIEDLKDRFSKFRKSKEIVDLGEGGFLEIFRNDNKKPGEEIKTKFSTIYKSDIVFLILPGGGYKRLMKHESLPVAQRYYSLGYSSAILYYSVYPKIYPTNYNQGLSAIKTLSLKFPKIILIGFSAGGHLAGILGTTDRQKLFHAAAMILCYPVISFEKKVHEPSRQAFLGDENVNNSTYHQLFSVDNRVSSDTLPTFIWTVRQDKVVPYENTLFMVEQLKKYNVTFEYEIFEEGRHGMGLADRSAVRYGIKEFRNKNIAQWVNMSCVFVEKIIKDN
jgi:acetyl esterase/lipase